MKDIYNILNMVRSNNEMVDVENILTIRGHGRNKRYQMSKYTTLNIGAYYINCDWENNNNMSNKVVLP